MSLNKQSIKWDKYKTFYGAKNNKRFMRSATDESSIKIIDESYADFQISSSIAWDRGIHRFDIQCIKPGNGAIGIKRHNEADLFIYWKAGQDIKRENLTISKNSRRNNLKPQENTLKWRKYDFIGIEIDCTCTDTEYFSVVFLKNNTAISEPIRIPKAIYHPAMEIFGGISLYSCHYDLNPFTYNTRYYIGAQIDFFDERSNSWKPGSIINENPTTLQYTIREKDNRMTVSWHKYSKQIAQLHTHTYKEIKMKHFVHGSLTWVNTSQCSYIAFAPFSNLYYGECEIFLYNMTTKEYTYHWVLQTYETVHIAFNGRKYLYLLTSKQCIIFNIEKMKEKTRFDLPESKSSVNSSYIPKFGMYRIASTGFHYRIDTKNRKCIFLGKLKKPKVARWKLVYNHFNRKLFLFYFGSNDVSKYINANDINVGFGDMNRGYYRQADRILKQVLDRATQSISARVFEINVREINSTKPLTKPLIKYHSSNKCLNGIVSKLRGIKKINEHLHICNVLDNICFIDCSAAAKKIHCYDFETNHTYSTQKTIKYWNENNKFITTNDGYLLMFSGKIQTKTSLMNILPPNVVTLKWNSVERLLIAYYKHKNQNYRNMIMPVDVEHMILTFYPLFL